MFLSHVGAFPLSGMVGVGNATFLQSASRVRVYALAGLKGRHQSHECVLGQIQTHFRKENTPLIGTSHRCLAKEPAFPVFWERPFRDARILNKVQSLTRPLVFHAPAPACLSKVISCNFLFPHCSL